MCENPIREFVRMRSFHFVGVLFSLLLAACTPEQEQVLAWEGRWERTIHVPKGFQGRCVNEILIISGKEWHLQAIVHSTFECNQPFLEIFYDGDLNEVKIRRGTGDLDLILEVTGIHLAGIVDVAGSRRSSLSEDAVKSLSAKYVPQSHESFSQKSLLASGGASMNAGIFPPVVEVAIPGYSGSAMQVEYKKINSPSL